MTDWNYALSDGETGTLAADDFSAAERAADAKATDGRTVTLVQRIEEEPDPPQAAGDILTTSPNGQVWKITVNNSGTVVRTKVPPIIA